MTTLFVTVIALACAAPIVVGALFDAIVPSK